MIGGKTDRAWNGIGAGLDIDMRNKGARRDRWNGWLQAVLGLAVMMVGAILWGAAGSAMCWAQENPLGVVHTPAPPPPPKTPDSTKPVIEGADNAAALAT